ncbi:hypothetical protein SAMN05192551_10562 [Tindallia magadiensis]|uniref:Uncharacterized protein n=1 Tax=Tindallia magadiensis TaxID=69895 RepID=A0A1I3ELP6_9FIRM|nr:Cys-Cys-COOH (seleno)protein SaoC [Tindallia magadiensis]SFH99897.1 hypothetical protein SAMN05192551_10562 [Tindallia magadiensis]
MKTVKTWGASILIIALVLMAGWNYSQRADGSMEYLATTPAIDHWRIYYAENELILWDQEDLTDNGKLDTVIIFSVGHRKNNVLVVMDMGDELVMTEPIPAPVENQVIEFLDFDNEPPNELYISGSKGPHVGHAIYRIVDGELVDLFSMDMSLCC